MRGSGGHGRSASWSQRAFDSCSYRGGQGQPLNDFLVKERRGQINRQDASPGDCGENKSEGNRTRAGYMEFPKVLL